MILVEKINYCDNIYYKVLNCNEVLIHLAPTVCADFNEIENIKYKINKKIGVNIDKKLESEINYLKDYAKNFGFVVYIISPFTDYINENIFNMFYDLYSDRFKII